MIAVLIHLSFYYLRNYFCNLQIFFCLIFLLIFEQNNCFVSQYSFWVYLNFIKITLLISELNKKCVRMCNDGSLETQWATSVQNVIIKCL